MAFKLTKPETKTKEALLERLREVEEGVQAAIERYNEVIDDVRAFCTDVAERAVEEWNEKSERWQEGDAGTAADEWISVWRDVDLPEVEDPDFCSSDFEELPDEVGA